MNGENDQDYHWSGDVPSRLKSAEASIAELEAEAALLSRSIAGEGTTREAGDDLQSVTVSTAESYASTLTSQLSSDKPLLLVIGADISGTRNSESYSYDEGDWIYFAPLSDDGEYIDNLSGVDQATIDRITTNVGNIQTNSNLIAANTSTLTNLVGEVDTLHPKIGRLVAITPWVLSDDARTLRFGWFPLGAVTTSTALKLTIGGIVHNFTAPEAYAEDDVHGLLLSVNVNAANAATITRESNTRNGFVRADLEMGDNDFTAYLFVARQAESGTTARTTVLTAIGSSTTSVTLPTDYAGYSLLEVEAIQSSGGTGTLIVPAGLLSGLSTATWTYASTQNGQSGVLSWNRSTRVLSGDSSNNINYAALTDGGPKGDKGDKGDRGDAGGLSTSQVDARIQTWGRAGNTSTIPDNKIPSSIARDSEVTSAVAGHLSFVEYSSESDVPNPVPAGTIAWVGETR